MSLKNPGSKPKPAIYAAAVVAASLAALPGLPGCAPDPVPVPKPAAAPSSGAATSSAPPKRLAVPALRFSQQGHVDLLDSVGLLDLNGDFTIELWVRVEGAGTLAGDDPLPPADSAEDVSHSAPGWLLRKVHLDPAEPASVIRYEFLMGRPSPESRFSVISVPVAEDRPWHHVAVSKSRSAVRLFVDGTQVAFQSCAGKQFVNSSGPISLGVPLLSPEARKLWGDIRAFRLSAAGRYHEAFVPTESLDGDSQTLALLDFSRKDERELPDLARNEHPGVFALGNERVFFVATGESFTTYTGIKWITDDEQPEPIMKRQYRHPPRNLKSPVDPRAASGSDDRTQYNEVRIRGRIEVSSAFLINRDHTECWFTGKAPEELTLNGVAWSPQRNGDRLYSDGDTEHLPRNMDCEDVSVIVWKGRGQVEYDFVERQRCCQIRVTDPEPGSDMYEIAVRFGVALTELPMAGAASLPAGGPSRGVPQQPISPGTLPPPAATGTRASRYATLYDRYGRRDPAWDAAVRRFLTAAEQSPVLLYDPRAVFDAQVAERRPVRQNDLPMLIESSIEALRAGGNDPLLLVVLSRLLLASHNDSDSFVLLAQAEAGFAESRYPAWCAVLVSIERSALPASEPAASAAMAARCAADFVALATGPLAGDEPQQLLAEMTGVLQRPELARARAPILWALDSREGVDPWLRHMVLARYHFEAGWYASAPGGKYMPMPHQLRAWKARLTQARAHLLEASRLNSDRPEAAADLSAVTKSLEKG